MTQILARLAAFDFLALVLAFGAGLLSFFREPRGIYDLGSQVFPLHLYFGLLAVFATLGVHCLVFIYFLGTGRWVKEVALAYKLPDAPLPRLTRDLKRRTFPPALAAMLVPIAAAAAGAGQRQGWPWGVHATLALATLVVNGWAFLVEYRNVGINAGVIDQVMCEVDRIRAEHNLPCNAEALRQEEERLRGGEAVRQERG